MSSKIFKTTTCGLAVLVTAGLSLLGVSASLFAAAAQAYEPELFGEGVISTGLDELNAVFSPDGRELYYSINAPLNRLGVIVVSRREGGRWGAPEVAPFSGRYTDYDPYFSADGSRLFFISNRPASAADTTRDFDIWVIGRTGRGWGEPRNLGAPVSTEGNEFYPSVAADGTLYFSANREGGQGSFDVYRARPSGNGYAEPENLGPAVNGPGAEIDNYIAPDQSFLVFAAYGREDGPGGGDLYISERRDGEWTPARLLGHGINSVAREYCPIGSPDGEYFYWTSKRGFADEPLPRRLTIAELRARLDAPGNGNGDIYRIPMEALFTDAP